MGGRVSRQGGIAIGAAVAVLVPAAIIGGMHVAGAESAACVLPSTGALTVKTLPEGASATACDAVGRVVMRNGVGAAIPEPGTSVTASAAGAEGHPGAELTISVAPSGTISYDDHAAAAEGAGEVGTSAIGACSDGSNKRFAYRVSGSYKWYIGDGTLPAGMSGTTAKAQFGDAINNITMSYNDCRLADQVGANSAYQGRTSREAGITTSSTCTRSDGVSVWDAGNIADSQVAVTCVWTRSVNGQNHVTNADVRFNTANFRWTTSPASGCSRIYDIRAVGTHEAGHVFGLGHVGGDSHLNLTMSSYMIPCSTRHRTLARGDVLGLRTKY